MGRPFLTAEQKDVVEGRITDVYFDRTVRVLAAKNVNPLVKAEFITKSLPRTWPWAVLTGLNEAAGLMKTLDISVRAMREGSIFYPYEPVLEITGRYRDFCVFETALLGLLCQASGISTQAARMKKLAGERSVMSFGARRMHPVLAPMIERNAYVGGCDGVSVVESGSVIGEEPTGTMPHSLILCMGSTLAAARAFDEVIDPAVKRIVLIDTFQDEKFEVLAVAEALGDRLFGVRFDTPASRRGNFYRILEEARWELDLRGFAGVRFFVSGGLGEEDIPVLNPLVHGYGIGTAISNAPVIDFGMDIMEIDGKPIAKRGKCSGSKSVLSCRACGSRKTVPFRHPGQTEACPCGGAYEEQLVPLLDHGRMLIPGETPGRLRTSVLEAVRKLEL